MLDFDRIAEFLYVGTCPITSEDVQQLTDSGFEVVVNLQSDKDFERIKINWPLLEQAYSKNNIESCRVPMLDFEEDHIVSLLPQAIMQLDVYLSAQKKTYLHCTAGRERSPTVAAGWLIKHGGLSLDQTLNLVRSVRRTNPYEHMLKLLVDH